MLTSSARIPSPTDRRLGRYPPDDDTPSTQHFHLYLLNECSYDDQRPSCIAAAARRTDLVPCILPAARRQHRYDTNDDEQEALMTTI